KVPPLALHWRCGAARCVRSHILGALSILKGAVPGRARGLGHMAPTYFRREPGIATPTAVAAPHLSFPIVMAGLVPAISIRDAVPHDRDARRKAGHDGANWFSIPSRRSKAKS